MKRSLGAKTLIVPTPTWIAVGKEICLLNRICG